MTHIASDRAQDIITSVQAFKDNHPEYRDALFQCIHDILGHPPPKPLRDVILNIVTQEKPKRALLIAKVFSHFYEIDGKPHVSVKEIKDKLTSLERKDVLVLGEDGNYSLGISQCVF